MPLIILLFDLSFVVNCIWISFANATINFGSVFEHCEWACARARVNKLKYIAEFSFENRDNGDKVKRQDDSINFWHYFYFVRSFVGLVGWFIRSAHSFYLFFAVAFFSHPTFFGMFLFVF